MDSASGLAAVYERIRRRLTTTIRSLVAPSEVEDILQEAFLRCYEASNTRQVAHPSAYLLRTALNIAINHSGRADQRLNSPLEEITDESELASTVDLEKQAIQRERLALYCRAVSELSLQCRRAFLLKKVYGLSQKEIAAYLHISESTVEKHIAKALLHCAARIREIDTDSRSSAGQMRGHGRG